MNSLPELIFTSLVALLLLLLPLWLPRQQECFTERYIQLGRYQYYTACWDGEELEIEDTGLAHIDSTFFNKYIQPKIDSLKND